MNGSRVFWLAATIAALTPAIPALAPATAAPAGGKKPAAVVVGFHCVPVSGGDDGAIPLPRTPGDLRPDAPEPGVYDVWLFLHTREPLVGAWTMTVALSYAGEPAAGIEILGWEGFGDSFRPFSGWPASGTGFRAEWRLARCGESDPRFVAGRDGWWVQPVLRLRVIARGPDRITLADPEPGVLPQMIDCTDEMHELDGSDDWTLVVPAVFGRSEQARGIPASVPVREATWGSLKTRHAAGR